MKKTSFKHIISFIIHTQNCLIKDFSRSLIIYDFYDVLEVLHLEFSIPQKKCFFKENCYLKAPYSKVKQPLLLFGEVLIILCMNLFI